MQASCRLSCRLRAGFRAGFRASVRAGVRAGSGGAIKQVIRPRVSLIQYISYLGVYLL